MRIKAALAGMCVAASIVLGGPMVAAAERALTNADVLRLTNAGVGDAAIVAMIEASATDFDTEVSEVVALAEAGVGETVIAAMVTAGMPQRAAPERTPPARDPGAPGSVFRDRLRDGGNGPTMVVVPAGRLRMGCQLGPLCRLLKEPVHEVTIAASFALSVHEVTFADYDRFTHPERVDDKGWGRGRRPAIYVSWDDAQAYVQWLSAQTGARYRLPTEAEWEYAARAGTATNYSWGEETGGNHANCDRCGSQWDGRETAPAGSFAANDFGLYDMHGNVWEWVQDCWNEDFAAVPPDGSAALAGTCSLRILRGGSWKDEPRSLRASYRTRLPTAIRVNFNGLRVARTLAN